MTKTEFIDVVSTMLSKDAYGNYRVDGAFRTYRIKTNEKSYRIEKRVSNGNWCNLVWGKVLYYKNMNSKKLIEICRKIIELSNTEPKNK